MVSSSLHQHGLLLFAASLLLLSLVLLAPALLLYGLAPLCASLHHRGLVLIMSSSLPEYHKAAYQVCSTIVSDSSYPSVPPYRHLHGVVPRTHLRAGLPICGVGRVSDFHYHMATPNLRHLNTPAYVERLRPF